MKLKEIASLLNGEILGDHDIEITGVSGINEATKGDITFVSGKRYIKDVSKCGASCVLVKERIPDIGMAQLKVSNPYLAFAKLLERFYVKPFEPIGTSGDAIVSDTARIGKGVSIFPFSYIADGASIGDGSVIHPYAYIGENTAIGKNCIIYPHVTVRENVHMGDRVIVHAGSVIGSDGFGYVFEEGVYHKIPQVGGVVIEDDVEIGSNVSIDRATMGKTVIGKGAKIDNLVQIGHNVKIGRHSVLCGQVGIGGSSEIGDHVTLAGQVGIADHSKIESGAMIGAKSGILGNVPKGAYSGSPAMPHREWLKATALFAKLPEIYKRLRELEEKMREIERRNT